jgi:hypothetical protein
MVMGYSKNQKPEGFPPLDPLQTGVRQMVRLTARQLQRRYQKDFIKRLEAKRQLSAVA